MDKTQKAYDLWSSTYDTDPNPHLVLDQESVLKLVDPSPGEYILDAACGTGRFSRLFAERGATIVGIDFSEKMLGIARSFLPDMEFQCRDLTNKLPFEENRFDKVNCSQALEHFADIRFPLSEFARVLKPKGTLTFSGTHPELNWSDYDTRNKNAKNACFKADIFPHPFWSYFEAIEHSGLRLHAIKQEPIDQRIKELLTNDSYKKCKGRYEIVIIQAIKE